MEYPETYLKKVVDWLLKLRYNKEYKFDEEHAEVTLICAKELNKAQFLFILYVGKDMVIKKDNEDNINNYLQMMIPKWNDQKQEWIDHLRKCSQRHQYARIQFRKDPGYGHNLMMKVAYTIPGLEEWKDEYDRIINYKIPTDEHNNRHRTKDKLEQK